MKKEIEVKPLDPFEATRSKDFPEFLIVFCPRDDCVGTINNRPFMVHYRTWIRPLFYVKKLTRERVRIIGRSCPYCFKASRIPTRLGR